MKTPGLSCRMFGCASALLLTSGCVFAADNWVEVRSPHFTVASDAGEKEARKVANQFEEIRALFLTAFPKIKLDSGRLLSVIAVKNENVMKEFLPDYWSDKDRVRLAGMYVTGFDRNYAILRTDVSGSGENPY